MVQLTGVQNIPSELLDLYRGTLTEKQPDVVSRKRYPYRLPQMQEDCSNYKPDQILQHNRFKTFIANFNAITEATRQRWYAARPPWSSFLWYYNYFIMSGLMDVLGANPEGASVIKSIKHYPFTMLAGAAANINIVIDEIDPTKAMVFPYGAGYKASSGFEPITAWAWVVYPYVVSIAAELVVMKASGVIEANADCSVSVIEYI